ncbi:sugar kinase [Streptomyces smyrnaeus]|uniref:sugar kinase n=1 Tax=Streptomyces smyrnaeus TaxID=1387713 RepID=UPI00341067FB
MTTTPDTDVVCLGESMVTFLPSRPGPLADVPSFDRAIGGAESNVACTLARAGHRARWVSRVGTDGFGDHLVREIAAHGVDTTAVERDPVRPTGIYFRTDGERATGADSVAPGPCAPSEVLYYRAGSAASAMSPANVPSRAVHAGQVLHLTGITAALSADCLALMRALTSDRTPTGAGGTPRPLVSFDVNYRVELWRTAARSGAPGEPGTSGAEVLRELARHSDIVFVGEDEAAAAWGVTGGPEAVREALHEPSVLVVKQGEAGATAFVRAAGAAGAAGAAEAAEDTAAVFAPALKVDVVSPVGAGDAFAAGFLAGTLRGLPVRERLRHGHLMAAAALTDAGDLAAPPAREVADRLAVLDDESWGRLRLGPGWTAGGPQTAVAGRAGRPGEQEPEVRSV